MAKKKIAILGGGVGAISAAFALTDRVGWQDDYDITVYQLGWRLGGKAASGRNAAVANRIQEHGIHIFFGFYENAFRMIRRCYWALDQNRPYPPADRPTDDDARLLAAHFDRLDFSVLEDRYKGEWQHLLMHFPPNDDLPGESVRRSVGPKELLEMLIRWLWDELRRDPRLESLAMLTEAFASILSPAESTPEPLHTRALASPGMLVRRMYESRTHDSRLIDLLDHLRRAIWHAIGDAVEDNDEARRLWMALDLATTVIIGMIRDGVVTQGYQAIDQYDLAAWLTQHGAHPLTVASPFVRALYSQAFAFPGGNPNNRLGSAAVALRANLRMVFEYRGAFTWRMKAPMGETIFTPL